ncbi:MAG: ABC transporter ATP-binding protein [Anaerolineae bacterium]|nr:ABC transporter ATP-binding protein [Anaerolineae bacterium]
MQTRKGIIVAQTALAAGERPARSSGGGIRRAIGYLKNHTRTNTLAYGALVIATLAQLVVPQLIKNMINAVTTGSLYNTFNEMNPIQRSAALLTSGMSMDQLKLDNEAGPALLVNAVLFIIVLALIRGVFSFVQAYMAESTSQGIAFDFRNEIFAKIQRLSFSYYDRTQTGQLMVRATDDVEKVRLFIAQGLIATAQALILLVASLTILFLINWRLTLVVLPILPVSVLLFMGFGAISQPLFAAVQRKLSTLNTVLQENVAGIKVVKAFVREKREQERLNAAAQDLFDQFVKVSLVFSILFPLIFFVAQVGNAGLLYFGGSQIINQSLSLGDYQQFSLYLLYLFLPLGQLGFIISLLAQASASASRIFEILDTESEVKNKDNAIELPEIKGNVKFDNVTFRYFSSGDPVLQKVSFEATSGMTVALLGATGSGKTTIINLLPRFYDVSEGSVLIDGVDVRDVTLDSLRHQIGIVLQETNLFSGTIRDNIAFGRPDASLESVTEAAKAAAAHDFILTFPQGYDTPVGERGTTLSGGQKQRIAIARALLLDPRLLILDDSTSSVDLLTEAKIQKALDNLMKGRTSFVIAQRITTVVNADLILVLDKGQVVAAGKHHDLMENSEIYADIYHSQLVGDVELEEVEA